MYKDVHSPLPSSSSTFIPGQTLQDYPGVQVGTNVHILDLAYADSIELMYFNYRYKDCFKLSITTPLQLVCIEEQGGVSAHHGEWLHAALLDGEPRGKNFNKLKYLVSMSIANGRRSEEIKNMLNLACSAFSCHQFCPWLWREMSLRARGKVFQAWVCSILPYGGET